MIKNDC